MSDVVRVAKQPQEQPLVKAPDPQDPVRVVEDKTEPPIALHQDLKGHPYTAEYFEVSQIWDSPDLSLKEDVEEIETYYKNKVSSGELEDSVKNYKALLTQAEKATNAQQSPTPVKIAKIAEFYRFMNRIDKIEKQRRTYG